MKPLLKSILSSIVYLMLAINTPAILAQAPTTVEAFDVQMDRLERVSVDITTAQKAYFPPRSNNDKVAHDILQFASVEITAASREMFFLQQMMEIENMTTDNVNRYVSKLVIGQKSYIQKRFSRNADRIKSLAIEAKKSQPVLVVGSLNQAEEALRSSVMLAR